VFAAIAMSGSAIADEFGGPDRPKHEWPDGPNRDFLKNLQRPDNHKRYRDPHAQSCCDAADTVQTKFKAEAGDGPHPEDQEHAWLNEKWASIPSDKIFLTSAPTGAPTCSCWTSRPTSKAFPAFERSCASCAPRGGL
jgi:hypothetical protein